MSTFTENPGPKVYTDVAGHEREVWPTKSKHREEWYYIWSWASCTDNCPLCNSAEEEDFCGERWEED